MPDSYCLFSTITSVYILIFYLAVLFYTQPVVFAEDYTLTHTNIARLLHLIATYGMCVQIMCCILILIEKCFNAIATHSECISKNYNCNYTYVNIIF